MRSATTAAEKCRWTRSRAAAPSCRRSETSSSSRRTAAATAESKADQQTASSCTGRRYRRSSTQPPPPPPALRHVTMSPSERGRETKMSLATEQLESRHDDKQDCTVGGPHCAVAAFPAPRQIPGDRKLYLRHIRPGINEDVSPFCDQGRRHRQPVCVRLPANCRVTPVDLQRRCE